jgi:hypothetical protein
MKAEKAIRIREKEGAADDRNNIYKKDLKVGGIP